MKYLIFNDILDAKERNHELWLSATAQPAGVERTTAYRYSMTNHPTTTEVAFAIPESAALPADLEAALVDELPADWTPPV